MTLARKIKEALKRELKPENIKTVIDVAEFLKFKEEQNIWNKINEEDGEYISEEEHSRIEKKKAEGEFIEQDALLKDLGIGEDEIWYKIREKMP